VRKLPLFLSVWLLSGCGEEPMMASPDTGESVDAGDTGTDAGDSGIDPTDSGRSEADAEVHACSGGTGTFAEQTIEVEGEQRFYFLHVPASYRCEDGAPLWIDFHGTAGDRPEEAYRTQELVSAANRAGAIMVRPRSRSSGGVYRWDQNPGDIGRNVRFTGALIEEMARLYRIEPERRYASGFSSGANMAAQFLGRDDFDGVAMVGGGYWADPLIGDLSGSTLRVYAVTGYRDYLIGTLLPLLDELVDNGLPSDRIFFRQTDTGHELYGWQFEEIWGWLDRGERREDGPLSARWMLDPTFASEDDLIQIEVVANGDLLATDRRGAIHRWTGGVWSEAGRVGGQLAGPLTGICVLPSGSGIAAGGGGLALTDDFGATWRTTPPAPETSGMFFGYAYLNDVACFGADSFIGGGYWVAVRSDDAGDTYRELDAELAGFNIAATIGAIEVSTASTAIAAGYFYLGRSDDLETFTDIGIPPGLDWLNDVSYAGGRWWIAGEAGAIARSIDDGLTWTRQSTPLTADLFAIDFYDENIGLAVGLHGAALYTEDGGTTWTDVSIGPDLFLGDVRWVDASTAIAVGERGTVLHFVR
jgi:photosystem II stability/assembly factor-like uncharacterized protein/predicted esterase